jgi:hypothetical protein
VKAGILIPTLLMAAGLFSGGCEAMRTQRRNLSDNGVPAGAPTTCTLVRVTSRQKHTPFGWETVVGYKIACGHCIAGTPGFFGLGVRPHVCLAECEKSFEACTACQQHPYTEVVPPTSRS